MADEQNALLQQLEALRNAQRQIEVAAPTPEEIEQERAARAFLSRDLRKEARKEYDERTTVGDGKGFWNTLGSALIKGGLGAEAVRNPKGSLDKQIYDDILEEYKVKAPRFQSDLNAAEAARARVEGERIRAQGNVSARMADVEKVLIQVYARQGLTDAQARSEAAKTTLYLAKAGNVDEQTQIMKDRGVPLSAIRGDIAQAIISRKDSELGKQMDETARKSALYKNAAAFLRMGTSTPPSSSTSERLVTETDKNGNSLQYFTPTTTTRQGKPGNPLALNLLEQAFGASGRVSRVGGSQNILGGPGASGSAPQIPGLGSAEGRSAPSGGTSPAPRQYTPTGSLNDRKQGVVQAPDGNKVRLIQTPEGPKEVLFKLSKENEKALNQVNQYAESSLDRATKVATITFDQAKKFMGGGAAGLPLKNIALPEFLRDATGAKTVRQWLNKGKDSSYMPGEQTALAVTARDAWQSIVGITGKAMSEKEMSLASSIWPDVSKGYINLLPRDFMRSTFLQALLGNAAKVKFALKNQGAKRDGTRFSDEELAVMDGSAAIDAKATELVNRWQRGEKLTTQDFLVDDIYPDAKGEAGRIKNSVLERARQRYAAKGKK